MLSIFRAIIDRVKSMFAVNAAQELESEFLLRDAERKADLLRQAQHYDAEGLPSIATNLRQQAEAVSSQRPLAIVLPALEHLSRDLFDDQPTPLLPAPASNGSSGSPQKLLPISKKKGRKS